jgi:hypothetical protein
LYLIKKQNMDANNKETISRLKFIGRIQIGDKVNLKDMYIQSDGLLTQIYRTINQDNRTKTLIFVQDTINKTFEILRCYDNSCKSSDKLMCLNLVNDLKNSKNGIINLKETYSNDIKFTCDLDTLLEIIEAKLSEIDVLKFSPKSTPINTPDITPINTSFNTPYSSPLLPPPPFPENLKRNDDNENHKKENKKDKK